MRTDISKKLGRVAGCSVALVAVCGVLMWTATTPVEARPQYKGAFDRLYSQGRGKITCDVCHRVGEKSKRATNHYAKDLADALGETNVRDGRRVEDALRQIENKSCTPGRTYLEQMQSGLVPCPHPAEVDEPARHRSIIERYLSVPRNE